MEKRKPILFIVGDSTAAEKLPEKRPEAGWGEYLQAFLKDTIVVENHAMNGRSTKSFLDEGRFQPVENKMDMGDFLVIQFGHNDQKEEDPARYTEPFGRYQENLAYMIKKARDKGACPVVFSSVSRRNFEKGKVDTNNLGDYPRAAIELAEKMAVPAIDLFSKTCERLNTMGEKDSATLFLQLKPGESENYPEGIADHTHFNQKGARTIAQLAAEELEKQVSPLRPYLK